MRESKKVRDISWRNRREMLFVFTNKFGPVKFQESICNLEPSANLMLLFYRQLLLLLKPMKSHNASKQRQYEFMIGLVGWSPKQFVSNKTHSFVLRDKRQMHSLERNTGSCHCIPCWVESLIGIDLVERIRERFWGLPMTVTELEPIFAGTRGLFTDTSNHFNAVPCVADGFCKELNARSKLGTPIYRWFHSSRDK